MMISSSIGASLNRSFELHELNITQLFITYNVELDIVMVSIYCTPLLIDYCNSCLNPRPCYPLFSSRATIPCSF